MKEYLVVKGLVLTLIFLFMVSVITPMTGGYKIVSLIKYMVDRI